MNTAIPRLHAVPIPWARGSRLQLLFKLRSVFGRLPSTRGMATRSRTYEDALELLGSLQPNTSATGLFKKAPNSPSPSPSSSTSPSPNARAIPEMLAWLSLAGITPANLPFRAIHIAGTKGKGSTATYASSVLRAGLGPGARVGTYTSPHLVTVRERISLDGAPIPRELFARYFFEVWDAVGCAPASDPGGGGPPGADGLVRPFYFRFLTILALHVFRREGIRHAVVECGIGGEYDATNVLPASAVSASVVTHLELDHVAMLGGTEAEIAWHKAGIFKSGVPAFTRPQTPEAMAVLRARAAEKGAPLVEISDEEAALWEGDDASEGPFERDNRALGAAAALCHLWGTHGPVTPKDKAWVSEAMRGARLGGRCQVLRRGPTTFYLDGAHTSESASRIGSWFGSRTGSSGPRRVLLFNQQYRDAAALLERVVEGFAPATFDEAIFTRNELEGDGERDVGVQEGLGEAMGKMSPRTEVVVAGNLGEALEKLEGREVEVLVTGSLYLVGGVLKALGEEEGQVDSG
ncbi:related to folylpolyglutamate synthetase [Cephalotrichum gorgonifer]|uniref:tetrahydrofolate synthase n=1 Tax=Cephalotrichum gorgonifer TaxID=2041049 RepID=A0AAE8SW27_9PEZI|nr:related to folylpolyglutamate synthetase [Cephalotrichum gorgonifer]